MLCHCRGILSRTSTLGGTIDQISEQQTAVRLFNESVIRIAKE